MSWIEQWIRVNIGINSRILTLDQPRESARRFSMVLLSSVPRVPGWRTVELDHSRHRLYLVSVLFFESINVWLNSIRICFINNTCSWKCPWFSSPLLYKGRLNHSWPNLHRWKIHHNQWSRTEPVPGSRWCWGLSYLPPTHESLNLPGYRYVSSSLDDVCNRDLTHQNSIYYVFLSEKFKICVIIIRDLLKNTQLHWKTR